MKGKLILSICELRWTRLRFSERRTPWPSRFSLRLCPSTVTSKIWQAADTIVFSTLLNTASSAKTRIERRFDPRMIQEMKSNERRDITEGCPNLAAQAFKAGLVDEYQLFLTPVALGGGKPSLPNDVRFECELLSERRFRSGVVFLHYRTAMAGLEHP
jgi:riboflavin biosynthesis pyrimidine reductase